MTTHETQAKMPPSLTEKLITLNTNEKYSGAGGATLVSVRKSESTIKFVFSSHCGLELEFKELTPENSKAAVKLLAWSLQIPPTITLDTNQTVFLLDSKDPKEMFSRVCPIIRKIIADTILGNQTIDPLPILVKTLSDYLVNLVAAEPEIERMAYAGQHLRS